ncbi:AraC family transcriptional regulator [Ekhidna sp.]|uniref:AraC family transcriptional regulator n=1 Tax=Ekhidna sp. TaxID=2608089 RepID=UPI003C7D4457
MMRKLSNKKYISPPLEKVIFPHEGSILVRQFSELHRNTRPYWHYHPELELVYVSKGRGKRHIGSHLSYFNDGELVLIGSNLPHQGFTERLSDHESETVVQMRPDFLGEEFLRIPEMKHIGALFERAKKGLSFYGKSKESIGKKIISLPKKDKFDQVLSLLDILRDLSISQEYSILNANGFSMVAAPQDNDRLNAVLNYVRNNFQQPISIAEISEIVSMTETSFCRYFKKITSKTFTQFLNEYRLVHASKLLAEKEISITEVCFECGFSNYSHFVDQFKSFTGKSPSNYRKSIQQVL